MIRDVEVDAAYAGRIKARFMKVGDLAVAEDDMFPDYEGVVILCTYDGFVSLNNPEVTWSKGCSLRVRLLEPGTRVTVVVG